MPALESMVYGTPVAMSDIPVFHEVAGSAALYFDQDKSESIADAWQKILSSKELQQKLADGGHKKAASYNWHTVAASLYNRIIQTLNDKKRV